MLAQAAFWLALIHDAERELQGLDATASGHTLPGITTEDRRLLLDLTKAYLQALHQVSCRDRR